jgi:hypothetical protein
MRKIFSVLVVTGLLTSGIVFADIDLKDFDTDAMKAIDDTAKDLDSSITYKDVPAAVSNAEFIRDSLHWAEGYFAQKGNADDAVKWSRQGRELADAIAASAKKKEFGAADDAFGSLKKVCKSCHDAYKPPSL